MKKFLIVGTILLIIILLFTVIDYLIHGLSDKWGVPDYYFRNKIPAGFLWGVVGLLIAKKFQNPWLKSLIMAGIISIALQVRYFIEGYSLNFVLIFLFFHFAILYLLLAAMFLVFKRLKLNY